MRALLAALIVCLVGFASQAQSREIGGPYDMYAVDAPAHAVRHTARHHVAAVHRYQKTDHVEPREAHAAPAPAGHAGSGLSHEKLADGQVIVVAAAYASRFVGFFNALFAREGKLPEIGCYAPRGHMRGSLHHWGGACDVGQTSRNVAWRAMYHVGDLARQFGLTDGCIWRNPDCGHVDVSGVGGGGHYVHRYASARRHRHRYAGA
jgi:hypothetical protein